MAYRLNHEFKETVPLTFDSKAKGIYYNRLEYDKQNDYLSGVHAPVWQ